MKVITTAGLVAFLAWAASAFAALTPQQVGAALTAENPNVLGIAYKRVTIKNTRCKEVRASGFRCITNYDTEGVGTYEVWLWVKPRPAGGLCVSPSGLRWVPSGCLANGRRARGSISDAYSAFRRKIRVSPMRKGECIGHGSGFYSCAVKDSTGLHRASVTFAPAPVVRVLG